MEDQEVEKVADFLRKQGEPEYDDRVTAEPDEEGAQEGGAGAPTGDHSTTKLLPRCVNNAPQPACNVI